MIIRKREQLTEKTLDFINTPLVCLRNRQLMNVNCSCLGTDPKSRTMLLCCIAVLRNTIVIIIIIILRTMSIVLSS